MEKSQNLDLFEIVKRLIVILSTLSLLIGLLFLRGDFNQRAPLEELLASSIEPNEAFSNQNPTILEFYAEWCESCRKMAPIMLNIEKKYNNNINLVMLNVDNPRWQDYIEKYDVNGIPQFNFFDKDGILKGKEIGFKNEEQFVEIINALISDRVLPQSATKDGVSTLKSKYQTTLNFREENKYLNPRSHG